MRLGLIALLVLPLASGCLYDELLSTHVEPGGKVVAQMDAGPMMTSTALAEATMEPLQVNGFSANLTFGLTAADDTAGSTPLAGLAKPNQAVTIDVTPDGHSRIEIHLGGTGCVAQQGTVNLHTDGNGNLGGDFQASGTRPDGVTACQMTGSLDGVPFER